MILFLMISKLFLALPSQGTLRPTTFPGVPVKKSSMPVNPLFTGSYPDPFTETLENGRGRDDLHSSSFQGKTGPIAATAPLLERFQSRNEPAFPMSLFSIFPNISRHLAEAGVLQASDPLGTSESRPAMDARIGPNSSRESVTTATTGPKVSSRVSWNPTFLEVLTTTTTSESSHPTKEAAKEKFVLTSIPSLNENKSDLITDSPRGSLIESKFTVELSQMFLTRSNGRQEYTSTENLIDFIKEIDKHISLEELPLSPGNNFSSLKDSSFLEKDDLEESKINSFSSSPFRNMPNLPILPPHNDESYTYVLKPPLLNLSKESIISTTNTTKDISSFTEKLNNIRTQASLFDNQSDQRVSRLALTYFPTEPFSEATRNTNSTSSSKSHITVSKESFVNSSVQTSMNNSKDSFGRIPIDAIELPRSRDRFFNFTEYASSRGSKNDSINPITTIPLSKSDLLHSLGHFMNSTDHASSKNDSINPITTTPLSKSDLLHSLGHFVNSTDHASSKNDSKSSFAAIPSRAQGSTFSQGPFVYSTEHANISKNNSKSSFVAATTFKTNGSMHAKNSLNNSTDHVSSIKNNSISSSTTTLPFIARDPMSSQGFFIHSTEHANDSKSGAKSSSDATSSSTTDSLHAKIFLLNITDHASSIKDNSKNLFVTQSFNTTDLLDAKNPIENYTYRAIIINNNSTNQAGGVRNDSGSSFATIPSSVTEPMFSQGPLVYSSEHANSSKNNLKNLVTTTPFSLPELLHSKDPILNINDHTSSNKSDPKVLFVTKSSNRTDLLHAMDPLENSTYRAISSHFSYGSLSKNLPQEIVENVTGSSPFSVAKELYHQFRDGSIRKGIGNASSYQNGSPVILKRVVVPSEIFVVGSGLNLPSRQRSSSPSANPSFGDPGNKENFDQKRLFPGISQLNPVPIALEPLAKLSPTSKNVPPVFSGGRINTAMRTSPSPSHSLERGNDFTPNTTAFENSPLNLSLEKNSPFPPAQRKSLTPYESNEVRPISDFIHRDTGFNRFVDLEEELTRSHRPSLLPAGEMLPIWEMFNDSLLSREAKGGGVIPNLPFTLSPANGELNVEKHQKVTTPSYPLPNIFEVFKNVGLSTRDEEGIKNRAKSSQATPRLEGKVQPLLREDRNSNVSSTMTKHELESEVVEYIDIRIDKEWEDEVPKSAQLLNKNLTVSIAMLGSSIITFTIVYIACTAMGRKRFFRDTDSTSSRCYFGGSIP